MCKKYCSFPLHSKISNNEGANNVCLFFYSIHCNVCAAVMSGYILAFHSVWPNCLHQARVLGNKIEDLLPTSPVPGVLVCLVLIGGRVKALLLDSCCYLLSHPLIYFGPIATDVTRICIILPTYLPMTYLSNLTENCESLISLITHLFIHQILSTSFLSPYPCLYLCICVTHNFRLLNYKASLPIVLGWEKWFHWPSFFLFLSKDSQGK